MHVDEQTASVSLVLTLIYTLVQSNLFLFFSSSSSFLRSCLDKCIRFSDNFVFVHLLSNLKERKKTTNGNDILDVFFFFVLSCVYVFVHLLVGYKTPPGILSLSFPTFIFSTLCVCSFISHCVILGTNIFKNKENISFSL
jgi:hypothetical protein